MSDLLRLVPDTNVLISRLLVPRSVAAEAVRWAFDHSLILMSEHTLDELKRVLNRSKFDRYVSLEDRQSFIQQIERLYESVEIETSLSVCRDPKDDKFLDVAVSGNADIILTGDQDLLILHPFREIAIISPRQFLDSYIYLP